MRDPAKAGYQCPFIGAKCTKRSHRISGPYPVCSIHRSQNDPRLVCTCPRRFYEAKFLEEVIKHCWPGQPPANPKIAHEVIMKGFGCVDFVIADIDDKAEDAVRNFISVELQAVDLTGSVEPAYSAALNNVSSMPEKPSFGVNWANVRKRYVAQLITKGFFHHHWAARMVSVVQTWLYDELRKAIQFDELDPKSNCNIIFMTYDYTPAPEKGMPGAQKMALDKLSEQATIA